MIYLAWTGGFDSTFRLLQILLLERQAVQPIYIMTACVDGIEDGRVNQKYEVERMEKLRSIILNKFPHSRRLLRKTLIVKKIPNVPKLTQQYMNLHNIHGYFTRPINQYERIARLAYLWKIPIEIGMEKSGKSMDEATRKVRTGLGTNCRIVDILPPGLEDLECLRYIRLPLVHLTKQQMLVLAKNYNRSIPGVIEILRNTFSCWYPRADGSPCGWCNMCRERVL